MEGRKRGGSLELLGREEGHLNGSWGHCVLEGHRGRLIALKMSIMDNGAAMVMREGGRWWGSPLHSGRCW